MKSYKIADLILNTENLSSDYSENRMGKYKIRDSDDYDVLVRYRERDNIDLPEGKVIKGAHRWYWIESACGKYIAFQRHPVTKKTVSLITGDKNWEICDLQLCEFENEFGLNNNLRSFMGIGEIFANAILKKNGFVLHASAINYCGKGILFSAPSGTGKSTHTSLWEKYYPGEANIINDDKPAIRYIDNRPFVYGTPWSGKTQINQNICAPIHAIVFIEKSYDNKITQLKGANAVSLMLGETHKPVYPEMMEITLEHINKVLSRIPVYRLSCNISKDAVELTKKALGI